MHIYIYIYIYIYILCTWLSMLLKIVTMQHIRGNTVHASCILSGDLALNRQPISLASLSQKTIRKERNKSHLKCNNA